jgi:hypothetical protein
VRLEPLYRLRFRYPESWRAGDDSLYLAEGRADGRVSGRFRGANRARRLAQGDFLPQLHGAIETDDGASILLDLVGHGDPRADPQGRVVAALVHTCDDDRYAWLDRTVCAVAGEVHDGREVVLDVSALIWEPLPEYDSPHER